MRKIYYFYILLFCFLIVHLVYNIDYDVAVDKYHGDITISAPLAVDSETMRKSRAAAELHAMGRQYFDEGRYKEAIDAWLKEAELVPTDANTINNVGIAYQFLEDYRTALKYHNKALELSPNFAHGYYSRGRACYYIKDYESALKSLTKAIELGWNLGNSYYMLGMTYKELGDCENAKRAFTESTKKEPDYEKANSSMIQSCMENHEIGGNENKGQGGNDM